MANFAVVTAISATAVVASGGTANASVWQCDGGWCTTVLNRTPVHQYADGDGGAIYYYLDAGSVAELTCHGITVYLGRASGNAHGWISGRDLATGHDPNPNIPPCT
ncbi:hypothetical protein [Lentzea aerocolonigenes]|nr:hypothetical protein [Lentzea aerocolonigenes]